MTPPSDRKPLLVLLAGACIIGVGAVLVRLTGTGAAAAGWWRLLFALPWLVGLTGAEWRDGGRPKAAPRNFGLGAPVKVLAFCGAAFAADLISWHYSLHFTSIANSTVLANLTPVIVTVLAWVVFRERPAAVFLAGLGLAVAGAGIMALAHSGGQGVHPAAGDALAVLASFWYALYFMGVREARRTASALQVMLASSLVAAPLMLAASLALHETLVPSTLLGWAACVGLGLMHVAGQGAIAWALGKVPTALAAVVVLVQPLAAASASWLVFGEAVTPIQALGGLIALMGVAVAQAAARRRPAPVEGEAEALAS